MGEDGCERGCEASGIKLGQGLEEAKSTGLATPNLPSHSQMFRQHFVSSDCRKALVLPEVSIKLYSYRIDDSRYTAPAFHYSQV